MDWFYVLCGIITIVAFVFALILYIREKDFKRMMEAQLTVIINELDELTYNTQDESKSKKELNELSSAIRSQAIGLLKTFSDKEVRIKTFDFGIEGYTIEDRIQKRKESLGIDYDGCIIEKQYVSTPSSPILIDSLSHGDEVLAYDLNEQYIKTASVKRSNRYQVKNYIRINDTLCLTANHSIYEKTYGWKLCSELTIGEQIFKIDGTFILVKSIELVEKEMSAFAITIPEFKNIFINDFLVHNEEDGVGGK